MARITPGFAGDNGLSRFGVTSSTRSTVSGQEPKVYSVELAGPGTTQHTDNLSNQTTRTRVTTQEWGKGLSTRLTTSQRVIVGKIQLSWITYFVSKVPTNRVGVYKATLRCPASLTIMLATTHTLDGIYRWE